MVGNLESGDYTIVSFSLSSKGMPPTSQPSRNSQNASLDFQPSTTQSQNLTVDIYYTDNIGERRIVTLNLPLSLSSSSANNSTMPTNPNFQGRNKSSWNIWYTIGIIAGVLVLILIILKKKFPLQSKALVEKIFKNKKKKTSSNEVPEWVKNNKEKERK